MATSTRKTFLADLANLAATLRARIEAEVTGFDPDPAQCQIRRKRAWDDFEYFIGLYFPHYVRSPHKSELHRYLFTRLPEIVTSPKSETDAIAAPRGEAKSTLVSQLFVLWCLVTARKRYPVIVMDSIECSPLARG